MLNLDKRISDISVQDHFPKRYRCYDDNECSGPIPKAPMNTLHHANSANISEPHVKIYYDLLPFIRIDTYRRSEIDPNDSGEHEWMFESFDKPWNATLLQSKTVGQQYDIYSNILSHSIETSKTKKSQIPMPLKGRGKRLSVKKEPWGSAKRKISVVMGLKGVGM
jgi:hypothetical protein